MYGGCFSRCHSTLCTQDDELTDPTLPCPFQLRDPPLHLLHPSHPHLQLLLLVLQPQPPVRVQRAEEVPALAVKLQYPPVVSPQASPVRDRHQRHAERLRGLVHALFHLERDGRGALVQDCVSGAVVEEAGHGEALLQADGERRRPIVFFRVPAAGPVEQVGDVDGREVGFQLGVRDSLGAQLAEGVRVDELLAEAAAGDEVGPLGHVED